MARKPSFDVEREFSHGSETNAKALNLAEDAFRGNEEQYRMLLDGIEDYAIFMIDPQGQILSWNARACRAQPLAARKNRKSYDRSFHGASTIVARILNSEGKTRSYLAIRADTSEGISPLSPAFCSVTYSQAASRDLARHLGEPEEPNSSSHFESIRDSSLTILFGMDYAA